ncbi:hypothetical protein [Streptomyces sp. NPDC031705]
MRTLPATGPHHAARASAWLQTFWYAIIPYLPEHLLKRSWVRRAGQGLS